MELEYDRVLSGSLSGYTEATQRLRALGALLPHDLEIRMALAQALSYRPATRPDAIEDMRQLATAATTPDFIRGEVMQSWRRTLEWMGADPQAEPYYQEWLALHPDDTEIASRLKAEQAARAQAARLALVGRATMRWRMGNWNRRNATSAVPWAPIPPPRGAGGAGPGGAAPWRHTGGAALAGAGACPGAG
ncbi:hypothetical protein RAA17_18545 [Komagataeibacter rhaeticus]|nr:hypothetical protein [Komagataeibacter rhaeticus]